MPGRLAGYGVVLGLSIRYRPSEEIQKLYNADNTRLAPTKVACMRKTLVGFDAGPSKTAHVIGYRLRVSADKRQALISAGS